MKKNPLWLLAVLVTACVFSASSRASAQISVQIGPPPVCPWGYYDFPPYNCAPYGYYGPEWFTNGIFIGAGPWYHGPRGFYGHVDHRFDPHYGYHGPFPHRGEHRDAGHPVDRMRGFHGNAMRDGRGHERGGGGHPR